ncbi:MAG: TonB-dependent receptor domain-containing protein, partial [Nitrospirales bacterium]
TTYRVTGGYLHKETGTKIRGSYGTGFRVPNINELVFPGFGNPNAQPEKSQSLDVGIEQMLFDGRVNFHATYFWNRYRNLLTTVISNLAICGPDPFFPSFGGSCVRNLGVARAQGGEFGVDLQLVEDWVYLKSLSFHGQYTLTYTRELEGLNPGSRLARWPVNQASGILSIQPVEPIKVNVEVRFVGKRFSREGNNSPLKSFVVFNLAGSYAVNKNIEFYTRVENLFNEKYEEVLFFGTPVRSIYGGVRVNFDVPFFSGASSNE